MGNFVNILQKRNLEKFCKTKERFVLETNEFAYNETVEVTDKEMTAHAKFSNKYRIVKWQIS